MSHSYVKFPEGKNGRGALHYHPERPTAGFSPSSYDWMCGLPRNLVELAYIYTGRNYIATG
jgi:hypothetical protein